MSRLTGTSIQRDTLGITCVQHMWDGMGTTTQLLLHALSRYRRDSVGGQRADGQMVEVKTVVSV